MYLGLGTGADFSFLRIAESPENLGLLPNNI